MRKVMPDSASRGLQGGWREEGRDSTLPSSPQSPLSTSRTSVSSPTQRESSPRPRTDQKGWVSSCSLVPWLRCPMGGGLALTLGEHRGGWAAWSGSYRSASGAGMAGRTERRGEASPPPPPGEERGGACSPARAGSRARSSHPAAAPSPAAERNAPPAPEAAPARTSCTHLRRGLGRPHPGRERARGRALGRAPHHGSVLGHEAPWRRKPGRRTRLGKFGAAPGEWSAPAPAASERPGRQRGFISEVAPRGPGAARPIGHERGFLQLPRPCCLPQGRPRRSPHPGPGVLPPAGAEQDCRPACGLRGKQAAAATALRRPPRPAAPSWRLASPPLSEQRGLRQIYPFQPAPRGLGGQGVPRSIPAAHPQRRTLPAPRGQGPRRLHATSPQSPAGAARPGVARTRVPSPAAPAPLDSPTPEARVSQAMEGAPAPPAGSLPQRRPASSRQRPRDARGSRSGQSSLSPAAAASPTRLGTAAPSCPGGSALLPTAGGFAERGSRWLRVARGEDARGGPGKPG